MRLTPVNRTAHGLLILLAALAVAAAVGILWPQLKPARPAAPVGVAMDLRRLTIVAQREGLSLAGVMAGMRAAGVDALVVGEQTLADLAAAGQVQIRWGWELLAEWRAMGRDAVAAAVSGPDGQGPYDGAFAPWRLFLLPADDEVGRWVTAALAQRWPGRVEPLSQAGAEPWLALSVPRNNPYTVMQLRQQFHRYEFPYSEEELLLRHLLELPLGFWAPTLEQVAAAGFHIVPRLSDTAAALADPREVLGPAAALPPGTLLLTADRLPGAVDAWADFLSGAGWQLGLRTGQDPAPWRALAAAGGGPVVRVHPVWPEETTADLVGRVVAGQTEILLYQWFMTLTGRADDPAHLDSALLAGVQTDLTAAGRQPGWPLPTDRSVGSAAAVGIPGAADGPLVAALHGAAILLVAAAVPVGAIAVGGRVAGRVAGRAAEHRPGQAPWRAVAGVLVAVIISLGGGLILAAGQAKSLLATGLSWSRAADWAPLAALVAGALALVARTRVPGDRAVGSKGSSTGPRPDRPSLQTPITFGHAAALAVVGLLAVLAVARGAGLPPGPSGPVAATSGWRHLLLLPPNPTLELLLTIPALLAAYAIEPQLPRGWLAALLLIGLIGQASLLAAPARVQIPLTVSLAAAAQGVAAGLILALAYRWLKPAAAAFLPPAAPGGGPVTAASSGQTINVNAGGRRP